jgi:Na+/phosphate symporter
MIERGSKMTPHFQALISRSMYLDLRMKTRKDYIVRIKQVIEQGMLRSYKLTSKDESEIMTFIEKNQEKMRELSLRIVVKLANIKKAHPTQWESMARVFCTK